MNRSFQHKSLEAFFCKGSKADIRPDHAQRLRFQSGSLDQATAPQDMAVPSRELYPLKGGLAGASVTQAATQLGVTRAYLSRILHGHAGISADIALRLSDLLGTSADLWQAAQQPRPLVQRMTVVA